MTLSVTLPATYSVKGVPLGKKARKEDFYAEFVTLDIPEVDADDAPLAMSWSVSPIPPLDVRFDYVTHWEVGACDALFVNYTLFHEGRHWLRLLDAHLGHGMRQRASRGEAEPLATAEFVEKAHEGFYGRLFGFARSNWTVPPLASGEDVMARYDIVNESSRPRVMRALDRLDLISVDGVLHMACDQPMIALPSADYEARRYHYPYVTARRRGLSDNPSADETRFLPFAMPEELATYTDAMPPNFERTDWDLVVHHAPSFSHDAELEAGADYRVSLVFSAAERARTKSYPYLHDYFGLPDLDAKTAFLERARSEWPTGRGGVSPALLDEALAVLEDRSIGNSLTSAGPLPLPRGPD